MNKRIIGLDVLKLISMFGILMLHLLNHGGILESIDWMSADYLIFWIIEIIFYCSVNCFALISGYIGVNKSGNYNKIISLFSQTIFYTLIITIIYLFHIKNIDFKLMIKAITPITSNQYWYISSYIGLCLFMPLLNYVLNTIEEKYIKKFLLIAFFFFSLLPTFLQQSSFGLENGYSTIWLMYLYLIGGFIKKYNFLKSISTKKIIIIYCLINIFLITIKFLCETMILIILKTKVEFNFFLSYISPFIVIESILLVVLFSRIVIKNEFHCNKIVYLSSLSLGVYLLHDNPIIRSNVVKYIFNVLHYGTFINMLLVFIICILIYLSGLLIEYGRKNFYKFLKMDQNIEILNSFLNYRMNKVIDFFERGE